MLLSWSLPRVFVATPVWRVRDRFFTGPRQAASCDGAAEGKGNRLRGAGRA